MPAQPDTTIDGVPVHIVWEKLAVTLYAAVSAMPLVSVQYDYSEHHQKLSDEKYYLAVVCGNSEANNDLQLSIIDANIGTTSGQSIALCEYIDEPFSVDFSDTKLHRFYISKNGISVDFIDVSPLILQEGNRVTMATMYYSDEYGFQIPEGISHISLMLTVRIETNGEDVTKDLQIPLNFEEKTLIRNAIR